MKQISIITFIVDKIIYEQTKYPNMHNELEHTLIIYTKFLP